MLVHIFDHLDDLSAYRCLRVCTRYIVTHELLKKLLTVHGTTRWHYILSEHPWVLQIGRMFAQKQGTEDRLRLELEERRVLPALLRVLALSPHWRLFGFLVAGSY
jgi:hypothetical protein